MKMMMTNILLSINWGDWSDPIFLSFVIFSAMALIVLIFMTVTFVLLDKFNSRSDKHIKSQASGTQIFVLDINNGIYITFSRSDMKNKHTYPLDNFYKIFHENDREKVKAWINSITLDKESAESFIEIDSTNSVDNKNSFSLLKLVKFNDETSVIHLEMQLLKYSVPTNLDKKKRLAKYQANCRLTMGTMKNIIEKSRSTKGYSLSIRFSYVNQAFEQTNEERLMVVKIKDCLFPVVLASTSRRLVEINPREMLLIDLAISDRTVAWSLAKTIGDLIQKTMQLNSYDQFIKYSIGIVENKSFYHDFNAIVTHAQEASLSAMKEDREICVYEKTVKPQFSDEKNNQEIDNIIDNNQLRYLFRPIVDVKNNKVLGYLHIIKPYGCPFTNYNEIIKYAYSCGRSKDIFTLVAKNVIPRYADEVPKAKTPLFYPSSILDFENIQNILPQITRIDRIKLVLVFEENEISQNNAHLKELANSLITLKLQGVELALSMMDRNLLLDPTFYTIFDYFVVGPSISVDLKKSTTVRMGLRTLIESLLKYKKPIIASSLDSWQSVELMVQSGVNYVSSEAISPSNEMVVPVDKKKLDKLTDIAR